MLRRRADVVEPVPGHDLESASAHLAAARDRLTAGRRAVTGDLRLRVEDDRVQLRQVFGPYTDYPRTSGRLTLTAGGTVQVVGTARESALSLLWVGSFGLVTLITLLGLAASVADGDGAGIAVCLLGALALGSLTWVCQRSRRSFPDDVEHQLALLRRVLAGRP